MPHILLQLDIFLRKNEDEKLIVYVQKEVMTQLYKRLVAAKLPLEQSLKSEVGSIFLHSAGVNELIHGTLRQELGITENEAQSATNDIAAIIANDIHVDVTKAADEVTVTVQFVRGDYREILSLPVGTFTSEKNGQNIPWLEWLLLEGDNIIFTHHVQHFKRPLAQSRAGLALMIRGGTWRIPPMWSSSSEGGNIIERAFENINDFILKQIEAYV